MAQYLRTELDGNIEYVSRIRAQYSSLSKKHRQIANYIFKHQQEVIHYSISTLAKRPTPRRLLLPVSAKSCPLRASAN